MERQYINLHPLWFLLKLEKNEFLEQLLENHSIETPNHFSTSE